MHQHNITNNGNIREKTKLITSLNEQKTALATRVNTPAGYIEGQSRIEWHDS